MSIRLLVATTNPGKVREFNEALASESIEVVGLETLSTELDVEETGSTFEANARIKAEAYSLETTDWVVADDSGIEVDALDGAPGVHSARYGGDGLDNKGRNRALVLALKEVVDPAQRTGRFRCVLAVARQGKTLAIFPGAVEGRILDAEQGEGGFGYDPLFYYPPFGCTLAEVPLEKKRSVSHRGQAIAKLIAALRSGELALD